MEFIVRKLNKTDLDNGFLDTLYSLRKEGIPKSEWLLNKSELEEIFEEVEKDPNRTTLVAEHQEKIIGTATIIIERKFIHKGCKVGHIEDVAVHEDFRRMKIGDEIIKELLKIGKKMHCYKTILDCDDHVIPFYIKLHFDKVGNEMRFSHNFKDE